MASTPIPVDLAALFGGEPDEDERPARIPAIEAEVLRDLAKAYLAPQKPFQVGDVVTWKGPAFRNARLDVAVVVEVLPHAVPSDTIDGGRFRSITDVCVLFRSQRDDELVTVGLDSRRLRLMTEDELRIVPAALPSAA